MVDAQQRLHVFLQFFFMKLCVVQYFVYLAQEPYVSTHGTVGRKNLLLVSLTSSVEHFAQKQVGQRKVAPSKGIQDSFGFLISHIGFPIPGTEFQSLLEELWIPKAAFQIPKPRIPDFTRRMLPDSGFH